VQLVTQVRRLIDIVDHTTTVGYKGKKRNFLQPKPYLTRGEDKERERERGEREKD
jgi:hypothetical protein